MAKIAILLGLAMALNVLAAERSITVCFVQNRNVDVQVLWIAENHYAKRIYQDIGVDLHWRSLCSKSEIDERSPGTGPNLNLIGIEWAQSAPQGLPAGSLASARPFQLTGMRISVYEDQFASHPKDRTSQAALLGHVLAHEIGHLILGFNGHSQTGLMKAHLTAQEEKFLICKPIFFSKDDAELIRRNLDHRIPDPVLLARHK